MDPLLLIGAITVGGVLIGEGVHFIPVGGAPAAIATANRCWYRYRNACSRWRYDRTYYSSRNDRTATMAYTGWRSCRFKYHARNHYACR